MTILLRLLICSETYEYYKLPYCKPKDGVRYKTLGMGEVGMQIHQLAACYGCLQMQHHRPRGQLLPLPCVTSGLVDKHLTAADFVQVVDANRMATTPYDLNFMIDRKEEKVCEKTLTDEDMVKFRKVSLPVHTRTPVSSADGPYAHNRLPWCIQTCS